MHIATRIGGLALAAMAIVAVDAPGERATPESGVAVRPRVLVYGGSPEQVELVRWAVERFEAAGLQVPPLEVSFHPDRSGCQGFPALYAGRRIHMCPGTILNLMPRRNILHEMGHVWITANLGEAERGAFLKLRGATTWSSWDAPWEDRGFEQAAEVIAWALGDRILGPRVEIDAEQMAVAYRVLTGSPLPA